MFFRLRRYRECLLLYTATECGWWRPAGPNWLLPTQSSKTGLRNSSQERNFLLQRPGGETGSFGSIAEAETALTREFGRHVFEIAALLRVSQRLYNYRVWVVGAVEIELVTPSPFGRKTNDQNVFAP